MPPLLTRRCLCLSLLVQLFSARVLVCAELQSGSRPFIQNQMRVWQRLHLRHFSARQLRLGKNLFCLFVDVFSLRHSWLVSPVNGCFRALRCRRAFRRADLSRFIIIIFLIGDFHFLSFRKETDSMLMRRNSDACFKRQKQIAAQWRASCAGLCLSLVSLIIIRSLNGKTNHFSAFWEIGFSWQFANINFPLSCIMMCVLLWACFLCASSVFFLCNGCFDYPRNASLCIALFHAQWQYVIVHNVLCSFCSRSLSSCRGNGFCSANSVCEIFW